MLHEKSEPKGSFIITIRSTEKGFREGKLGLGFSRKKKNVGLLLIIKICFSRRGSSFFKDLVIFLYAAKQTEEKKKRILQRNLGKKLMDVDVKLLHFDHLCGS